MKPNQRNLSFDLLRAVGLLCIILAHVNPPDWLLQLRCFDVVMMVCISTVSYTEYSKPKQYLRYLTGRIKRLLLPAWEYILLLGVVFYVIALMTGTSTPYPLKTLVIGIFTLSSVGYLWIIRVFLYNAFINPFIPKIAKINRGGCLFDNSLRVVLRCSGFLHGQQRPAFGNSLRGIFP